MNNISVNWQCEQNCREIMLTVLLIINVWLYHQRNRTGLRGEQQEPECISILQTHCCSARLTETVLDPSANFAVCPFCYDTKPVGHAGRILSTGFQWIFATDNWQWHCDKYYHNLGRYSIRYLYLSDWTHCWSYSWYFSFSSSLTNKWISSP